MNGTHKEWIIKAEEDNKTCEILLKQDYFPTSVVCFHSQQMAEKYLKAYLTANNIEFPKVHDIVYLLDIFCIPLNENLSQIRNEAILLSDYSVLPRYPGEFGFIDNSSAKEAYQAAITIKELILRLI